MEETRKERKVLDSSSVSLCMSDQDLFYRLLYLHFGTSHKNLIAIKGAIMLATCVLAISFISLTVAGKL